MILVRVELVGYISEIGVEERANRPSISYKLLIKLDIRGRGRTFHFTSDFVNYPPSTSGITIDLFKEMYVINCFSVFL